MSVQRVHGCALWESCCQCGSSELGCATTGRKDRAYGNVLDESRIELAAFKERHKGAVEEIGRRGIFEATFAALGVGSAEAGCHDDIVGMFLQDSILVW